MLRTVVMVMAVALLLANLGLAAWHISRPAADTNDLSVAPSVASGARTAAEPTPDLPGLRLVSEMSRADEGAARCHTLGPFTRPAELRRAHERLAVYTQRQRQRQTQAVEDQGWWVHLPASASRAEALSAARRLTQAGVSDHSVITSGEHENTVSLGLFDVQANARSHRARIRGLGFDVLIGKQFVDTTHYWLDYEPLPGMPIPWARILNAVPTASRTEIPCFETPPAAPDDASPDQSPAPADSQSASADGSTPPPSSAAAEEPLPEAAASDTSTSDRSTSASPTSASPISAGGVPSGSDLPSATVSSDGATSSPAAIPQESSPDDAATSESPQ